MDRYKIVACGPNKCKIQHRISKRDVATFTDYRDAHEFELAVNTIDYVIKERDQVKAQRDQLLIACQQLLDFLAEEDAGPGAGLSEFEALLKAEGDAEDFNEIIDQIREAVKEIGVEDNGE